MRPRSISSQVARGAFEYIVLDMKQVLLQLDDELAERIERVAPARSRKRAEFIRKALLKALWDAEEDSTAEAYRRQPDGTPEPDFLAETWEPKP